MATVAATFALLLLGIYTAAVGAGLACEGRWPLCDGWLGLFPANWPSFVEWFHRLIAMLTGFMILGTWIISWRSNRPRRGVYVLTVAVALLPVQIWLGAETVLSYETLFLLAHLSSALIIYTGILLGVAWTIDWSRLNQLGIQWVLVGSLALAITFTALTRGFLLVIHSPEVQLLYYGIGLLLFTSVVLVTDSAVGSFADRTLSALSGFAAVLVATRLVIGRFVRTDLVATIDWAAALVLLVVLFIAVWWVHSARSPYRLSV